MEGVEDLKQQLKALQEKREEATKIKNSKSKFEERSLHRQKAGKFLTKLQI